MDPFERVQIGSTGVWVTRLGLGGSAVAGSESVDGLFRPASYVEGVAATRRAYDAGIRYFDTAPACGIGRGEVRYGAALSGRRRNSFVVSTKAGYVLEPDKARDLALIGPDGLPSLLPRLDLTRDGIRRSHDESLYRLLMNRVDILYLHGVSAEENEEQAVETAMPALLELRREGGVRAVGLGTNDLGVVMRFMQRFDIDVVLLPDHYTLLDQRALEGVLPLCEARGIGVVIGTPYRSGILASDLSDREICVRAPALPDILERARAMRMVCERYGADFKAAALQFVLAHPAVVSVIPGARSAGEVDDNVRMVQRYIPAALWADLKREALIPEAAPTP